jgi:hypothetical protein
MRPHIFPIREIAHFPSSSTAKACAVALARFDGNPPAHIARQLLAHGDCHQTSIAIAS